MSLSKTLIMFYWLFQRRETSERLQNSVDEYVDGANEFVGD